LELKNLKKTLFFTFHFSLFIFLFGCSVKTTPVYAVIKTPDFKVADQGFLKEGFGYKQIIIYKAANAPIKITVKNSQICLNGRCMDKEKFIKEYLGEEYPSNFLDKILNKECIEGFFCKKYKNKILFKDKKRGIVIMIKELKNGI
jgi:hypothetical protein